MQLAGGITKPSEGIATNVTGPAVDLVTSDARCFAIQVVGSVSGVGVELAGKVQESPTTTAASFTDIPGATFTLISQTSGTGGLQLIGFTRTQRYLRYVADVTGTTIVSATTETVMAIALAVLLGDQRKQV